MRHQPVQKVVFGSDLTPIYGSLYPKCDGFRPIGGTLKPSAALLLIVLKEVLRTASFGCDPLQMQPSEAGQVICVEAARLQVAADVVDVCIFGRSRRFGAWRDRATREGGASSNSEQQNHQDEARPLAHGAMHEAA